MSPEEKAGRASRINEFLDHPEVKAGFDFITEEFVREWRTAQTVEERENMHRALRIMENLQTWMRSTSSGDLAALRRTGLQARR